MPLEKLEEELEDTELVKKEKIKEEAKTPKEILAKVVRFTNEARKQYGDIIKSVLIFGSAAKGTMVKGSDADIWVVLDDTATKSSEDLEKVNSHLYLIAHELKELHIQTTTLTEFWSWIKMGSPELVNFLRYGLLIYDTGFVKPVQRMLNMGLIPPSEETIALKAKAAEARYRKIKIDIKSMIFELRYTATDACQAVIMYFYKAQPDAKAIPEFLEKLVKEKKLEKIYVSKFKELDKLWKDIDHKEIKEVTTQHLEKALILAKEIVGRFNKLLPKEIVGEELPEEE
ncbi:MAG TPA: nucleotidyltransferase domain-containing protein [archaeon]|nr:nucleotidyltransferase domain-containing protein [archaeon]